MNQIGKQTMWILTSWFAISLFVSIIFGAIARGIRKEKRQERRHVEAKANHGIPELMK
jgi:hypothetical protein